MGHLYMSFGILLARVGNLPHPYTPTSEHHGAFLQPVMPTQPEVLPFTFP